MSSAMEAYEEEIAQLAEKINEAIERPPMKECGTTDAIKELVIKHSRKMILEIDAQKRK